MSTKQGLIRRLREHEVEIRRFGVQRLGLFGSFVKQRQVADSDVDLLVEFHAEQETFKNFMGLGFLLEDILGRRVEILTPESLSPYIGPRILEEVEYVAFRS